MADEVEMDQQVYDDLIAQGKSERIARAKAKAAWVRANKKDEDTAGPSEQTDQPAAAKQPAAAAAAGGQGVAKGAPPRSGTGVLTPEERQARVAAALAAKGNGPTTPTQTRHAGQAHTHRLLAMVPPTGIQQIRAKQEDKVYTWPHLITAEFVALMAMMVFLTVFSALVQAPLLELANANVTPNPSKAPWYFMGLQELLAYFHPMVAGVTIPTLGIVVGMMLPYLDKNPSLKPENRKLAVVLFTFAMVFNAVLVIVGSFFRGPGFNWVWPWVDGLWFQL
jgi:menaquinol-cytochrome c reductase cytochrome b/c subunit